MTSLSGPIVFNSSTGSDTAASGCGPASVVQVFITTTAGSNTASYFSFTTLNVNAGDVMFIPSFTGRKFNVIASVTSNTITFDENWDDGDGTYMSQGYVGGKRATFDNADSRFIFKDIGTNNAAILKTETDQTLTSAIAGTSTNAGVSAYIESADDTLKTITQTANAHHFNGGGGPLYLKKLKLDNSSSSKPASIFKWGNDTGMLNVHLEQCTLGDPTNTCVTIQSGGGSYRTRYQLNNCIVQNMTGNYAFDGTQGEQLITNNLFINNNICVGRSGSGGAFNGTLYGNIFANSTAGVSQGRIRSAFMRGNIFYNCTTGVYWSIEAPRVCDNNLFVNCTTAINNNINTGLYEAAYKNLYTNFFYNNTTKYTNNTAESPGRFGDIDLQADPFVDASNGDFNLNNALGGGSVLRSTKYTLGG